MRRVVPLVVSASLCTACDGIWDLEHIDEAHCATMVAHDEDGDGLDDACDPCPFDANNGGDEDHDGIAIACDPDPGTPNEVVFFSGFDPEHRTGLDVFDGYFAADSFDGTGPVTGLVWNGNPDGVWVIVGVDVHAVHPAQFRELGIIFDVTPSSGSELNGVYCVLGLSTSNYLQVYLRRRPDGDLPINTSVSPLGLDQVQGTIRASYSRAGPAAGCTFETPQLQPSITGMPPLAAPGGIVLWADDLDVTFRFLFVTTKS